MNFTDGVEKAINDKDLPVITFYEFFVLGYHLFHKKALNGEPLKRLPHDWVQTRAKNALRRLEARKALVMDSDFRSGVWRVDPPPLKWSAVMFRKTEDQNGYEETQAGRDCHEAAAG